MLFFNEKNKTLMENIITKIFFFVSPDDENKLTHFNENKLQKTHAKEKKEND
jgi:hypothetical protein